MDNIPRTKLKPPSPLLLLVLLPPAPLLILLVVQVRSADAREDAWARPKLTGSIRAMHVLLLKSPLLRSRGAWWKASLAPIYAQNAEGPSQFRVDWDPFENLYGLGMNMSSSIQSSEAKNPRSWYGPEGQYVRELPCPSCRGRGYLKCSSCSITSREPECPQCSGKGLTTCPQCLGDRVIWEESVNESAWESARSRSPLKVADDEVIESMDLPPGPKRKAGRVYKPTPSEVREKISRSLKELERRTGSISRRMKKLHQDPVQRANRTAAIKKAKSAEHARQRVSERQKLFFQDPKNRLDRSLAMKGVPFTCKTCGVAGHRSHFCPATGFVRKTPLAVRKNPRRKNRCSNCGLTGHLKRNCPNPSTEQPESGNPCPSNNVRKNNQKGKLCGICRVAGHNRRTCSAITPGASELAALNC